MKTNVSQIGQLLRALNLLIKIPLEFQETRKELKSKIKTIKIIAR